MRKNAKVAISVIVAGVLGLLSTTSRAEDAKYVSWEGKWHLNKTETHYPPGVLVTANDMIVSKDDGKILKYSETVTVAGKTSTQAYDGAYDGKPYPVGAGEVMIFKHIDATSYSAERHNPAGFVLERSTFVLSNGGKKLTCHAWAQQPGGQPIMFDEIFDKES